MRRLLLAIITTILYINTVSATHLAAAPADIATGTLPVQSTSTQRSPVLFTAVRTIESAIIPSQKLTVTGPVLHIASINLQAPIAPVGVTDSNAIDVPTTREVGRWIGSSDFGSPGTAFLDGHNTGVFTDLHKVTTGQLITIAAPDQLYAYRIVRTETIALTAVNMPAMLGTFGGSEGLVLMTCAGDYQPSQATYDKRFVVYAVRV